MSIAASVQPPSAASGTPSLRVEGLRKAFGGRAVLDGIDLSVEAGESLVIVGPSGTGKSVLLKHFIGLLHPDGGRVFVDGQDLWALDSVARNSVRKKFGMAFQEGALFDSMTVYENVAFPLRHSGRSATQVGERVEECLELVRLPDIGGRRPAELSGGMRRRVGFARAIAHEPQILLFDEPNTGLDPITTDVIAEVILGIRRQLGVTIVTITHHMASARKIGDRLALLFGGHILFQAAPEEFMKSYDPAVRQFVEGRAEGPLTVEFEKADRKEIWEAR